MRRLPRRAGSIGIIIGALLFGTSPLVPDRAAAETVETVTRAQGSASGVVDVIQLDGYLDPIMVDFVSESLRRAASDGDLALVLQIDSPGSVVSRARLDALLQQVRSSRVAVAAWVGPSGARVGGGSAEIVLAAEHRALAPGSTMDVGGRSYGPTDALASGMTTIGSECKRDRGSTEGCAATIGDLIVSLPEVPTKQVEKAGQTRLEPTVPTRFSQLSLLNRMMHTVASPPVAYLFLVIGMALLLFELFTAGVGIAGVAGAVFFLLGGYGLAVLPTRPWAVVLLVVAMFGYAVDIQTGVPRVWTGIATVSFTIGSLLLYDGLVLSWITLVAGVLGMTVAMLAGMPAMVRSRFSTPTIGREWIVGEEGEARSAVDPDGVVVIRGAPWRARTNRATPVRAGEPVRVVALDGLVLEVEPTVGAARDYRS